MDYPLLESFVAMTNQYYVVEKPFEIHWLAELEARPGGMFSLPIYKKSKMRKGDQIFMLIGGQFAVRKKGGDGVKFSVRPRGEPHPDFAKATVETKRVLVDVERLLKKGTLREIPSNQAVRNVKYAVGKFPNKF
jgi:hypothetical protein